MRLDDATSVPSLGLSLSRRELHLLTACKNGPNMFEGSQSYIQALDERVFQKFTRCYSPSSISVKQLGQNSASISIQCLMVLLVVASLNLSVQVLLADSSEGESSSEHDVEEDSKGPHVHWLAIIVLLTDNFRTHVTWSATEHL